MKNQLVTILAALGFFTRIPVPAAIGQSPELLDRAVRYLPLVGVLVGAAGAAVTMLTLQILPSSVAVLLGMITTVLLTGAFHEDGLADAADGFGGGWERERVLAIMKDSRLGSYGALALVLALGTKFHAVQGLPWETMGFALIAGHAGSRLAVLVLMRFLDYARDDESARVRAAAQRPAVADLLVGAVFGLAPFALLPWENALLAAGLAAVVTLLAARYFRRRIGGYTGDCLGATQQVVEVAIYIGLLCNFS